MLYCSIARLQPVAGLIMATLCSRCGHYVFAVVSSSRVPSKELRERLGIDDIILILQQNRLRWYAHVLRKKTLIGWRNVWNMRWRAPDQEVDQRTWREVVQKDCQARNLNREDAMNRGRWKKMIKIGWRSGWWVGECFFWYWLTWVVPDKGL